MASSMVALTGDYKRHSTPEAAQPVRAQIALCTTTNVCTCTRLTWQARKVQQADRQRTHSMAAAAATFGSATAVAAQRSQRAQQLVLVAYLPGHTCLARPRPPADQAHNQGPLAAAATADATFRRCCLHAACRISRPSLAAAPKQAKAAQHKAAEAGKQGGG